MPTKDRIQLRTFRDYEISIISPKGNIGDIEEVSFAPATDQLFTEEGFVKLGISVKIKEVNSKSKASPGDTFQINTVGRQGTSGKGKSENIQSAKLALADGEKAPTEFENGRIYLFTGLVMKNEEEEQEKNKVASSFNAKRF